MGNDQSRLEAGDLIYRPYDGSGGVATNASAGGILVYHYGIYIGDDKVIDFTKDEGIRKCSLDEFAAGCEVSRERVKRFLYNEETVQIAIHFYKNPDEWGEYSLVFNNCEHFAKLCVTGVKQSNQVAMVALGSGIGAIGIGIWKSISDVWLEIKENGYPSFGLGERKIENHEKIILQVLLSRD